MSVNVPGVGAKSATVPLPEIHLTNLGQGADGITVADLTAKVMKELTEAALKAAEKGIADIGKIGTDAVKDAASKAAGETLDKATKSVTDILKKKK